MKNLKIFGITDIGMVREENEDSYFVKDYGDMAVLVVADGMGGHVGGKIASTTAVKTIEEAFNRHRKKVPTEELMVEAMKEADRRIREKAKNLPENMTMGTTCTMAVVRKGKKNPEVLLAHVGDSKLYQIRDDMIVQRSEDHTWIAAMLKAGAITEEEAKHAENRNIITRSLGGGKEVKVDPPQNFELEEGDVLLLCSDGLTGYVTPEEIVKILKGTKNIKQAANYMVELAKSRGGDDNITVIIAEWGKYKRDRKASLPPLQWRKTKSSSKTVILIILSLMLAVLVGLLLFILKEEKTASPLQTQQKPALEKKTEANKPQHLPLTQPEKTSEPESQPFQQNSEMKSEKGKKGKQ